MVNLHLEEVEGSKDYEAAEYATAGKESSIKQTSKLKMATQNELPQAFSTIREL